MHIELKNLALKYGEKETMFEHVNLSISSGDFVLIQGTSGSGKSSLFTLKMIPQCGKRKSWKNYLIIVNFLHSDMLDSISIWTP